MNQEFAGTAALLSDPARASMLMALLGGASLPAGQLAMIANVSPQTASSHLSRLVNGSLLSVKQQGRCRYYSLAHPEVANAIEALLAIGPRSENVIETPRCSSIGTLRHARTCYSHLAGQVAVKIADVLQSHRILVPREPRMYKITRTGREWF